MNARISTSGCRHPWRVPASLVAALLTTSFFAASLAVAAPAGSSTVAPVAPTPAALALLGAIDVPLDAAKIARVGLTEGMARAVLADSAARRYLRLRALSCLPFFGTASGRQLVEETLAGDADPEVRAQAVLSLSWGFGPVDPVGVRATLDRVAPSAPAPVAEVIAEQLRRLAARPADLRAPAGE